MNWLYLQMWFLMLLAFVAGAVVAYVVASRVAPHVDRLSTSPGPPQEGVH
jgi:HAMP domain-containing protein